jgi:hypothetical protein
VVVVVLEDLITMTLGVAQVAQVHQVAVVVAVAVVTIMALVERVEQVEPMELMAPQEVAQQVGVHLIVQVVLGELPLQVMLFFQVAVAVAVVVAVEEAELLAQVAQVV